jgi:rubrerythrin
MELNKVLDRVRKLTALAEHEGTGPAEAKLAREQADALMLKFAIDQAMINNAKPADQQAKPGHLEVELSAQLGGLSAYVSQLAEMIGKHCRCLVKSYSRYDSASNAYLATAYGFEGDLQYFEVMYTTVRLHMLGALRPQFEKDRSLEDNCYALHEAGYNWLEIAELDGWTKVSIERLGHEAYDRCFEIKVPYYNKERDQYAPSTQVGSHYKRAYLRAVKAKGETPTQIQASSSHYYRADAVQGYIARIRARLTEARRAAEREAGNSGAVVLAGQADRLEDFYRENNERQFTRCPACKKLSNNSYECDRCGAHIADRPEGQTCPRCEKAKSGHCREHPAGSYSGRYRNFNEGAYRAGTRVANTADLGTQRRAGSGDRKAL